MQERSVNKVLLAFLTARHLGYKAVHGRLRGLGECRCSAPTSRIPLSWHIDVGDLLFCGGEP